VSKSDTEMVCLQMSAELRSVVSEMLSKIDNEKDVGVKEQLRLKLRKVLGEDRYRSVMGLPPNPVKSAGDAGQKGTLPVSSLASSINRIEAAEGSSRGPLPQCDGPPFQPSQVCWRCRTERYTCCPHTCVQAMLLRSV
jgi:hypothetical protein